MLNTESLAAAHVAALQPFEALAFRLMAFVPKEWPEMEDSGIWEVSAGIWLQSNDALGAWLGEEIDRNAASDEFIGSYLGINVDAFNHSDFFIPFGTGRKGFPRESWHAGTYDQDAASNALRLAAITANSLVFELVELFDWVNNNLFLRGDSPMLLTDPLWEGEDIDQVFRFAKIAGGFEADGRVWTAYMQNQNAKRKKAQKIIEMIGDPITEAEITLSGTLAGTWKRWRRGSQFGWRGP